jgi:DNA-directed RNA polymerase subunit RPC12/RpoP
MSNLKKPPLYENRLAVVDTPRRISPNYIRVFLPCASCGNLAELFLNDMEILQTGHARDCPHCGSRIYVFFGVEVKHA